jgi:hypothetical protein
MAFSLEALRLGNGTGLFTLIFEKSRRGHTHTLISLRARVLVLTTDSVKTALYGLDAAATHSWLEGLTAELAKSDQEDLDFLIVTIGLLAQRCTHRECMELFLENSADYLRSALLVPPEFLSKVQIKTSAVQVGPCLLL